jgi:hypothetical protein
VSSVSHPVSELSRRRAGSALLVARSRRELLRHLHTIVVDVAPAWRDDESAVILVTDQRLGRAEVEQAYDELDERYRLRGIELHVDGPEVRLRAVCGPRA